MLLIVFQSRAVVGTHGGTEGLGDAGSSESLEKLRLFSLVGVELEDVLFLDLDAIL